MKNNYLKIGITLISVSLVILYAGYLYIYGEDFLDWKSYVIQNLLTVGFASAAILLHKYLYQKNTTIFCCIILVLAMISFLGISFMTGKIIKCNFEMLIVAMFPVLCYIALKRSCRYNLNSSILIVAYNLVVVAIIWVLQEVAFKEPYFASDVIAEVYMYITAELTLIAYLIKEVKTNNSLKTITCLIFVNIMAIFLFLQQERISEIISSFNNSFSDTNIEGDLINWLAYRVLMLKNNIYGDFSTINIHYMKALVEGCPIAWMSSIYGLHIGLSIIVAEIVLITTMLIYARKSRNTFIWIIATTFLLKGIIGFISNLFLMFSTNIGFPIVSNGYDLILVMLFIVNIRSRKVEGNIVCAPKEQSI